MINIQKHSYFSWVSAAGFLYKKLFLLLLITLVSHNTVAANTENPVELSVIPTNALGEQRMSLDCNGRSLEEIIEEVALFFQTDIVYQTKDASLPVQCHYSTKSLEQILGRLFDSQNHAILYLPEHRVVVQVFGVSKYNVASNSGNTTTETVPFLANMTNEALETMQREQLKKYREELKDDEAVIALVGLTRSEISNLHFKQLQQQTKDLENDNRIIAGMKINQQQLKNLHKQQLTQYEAEKQNQIDPFTGLTMSEIAALHYKQLKDKK